MPSNKKTRADMRGKPLMEECRKAAIIHDEGGNKEDICFCCGLRDRMFDDFWEECHRCGAFFMNADTVGKGDSDAV